MTSLELLQKYDRPGPRYTSYPTVPEWTTDFDSQDYTTALKAAGAKQSPISLYFHIPFCRSRCFYCGCNTCVSSGGDRPRRYLAALDAEMSMIRELLGNRDSVEQLHWGGGTPTFLTELQMTQLFDSISANFNISPDAEVAIEVDPRVTTVSQLSLLRKFGFNRISLGVQDFDDEVQKAIGRYQTYDQTQELFTACRELGFEGINIDLIYGLPLQTVEKFAGTIERVIEMGADRVAVYSYAHLPSIKAHQKKIIEADMPNAELKYRLFAKALDGFLDAGYVQIGMDHFAKPSDELSLSLKDGNLHRNFMGYTTKRTDAMIGVGMSAISDLSGCFAQNLSELDGYMQMIESTGLATFRGISLSENDKIRRWIILSLMCRFELSFEELSDRFGIDFSESFEQESRDLKQFVDDGLIDVTDRSIAILPDGRVFVRNVAMVFDSYLRTARRDKPLFSRTI